MAQREVEGGRRPGAAARGGSDGGSYLSIEVDGDEAGFQIVARGELDAASAPKLAGAFARENRPGRAVELDLSDLTFVDSSGLRVIAFEFRRYDEADTAFTVRAASEPVRRIFTMAGLGSLLTSDPPSAPAGPPA